MYRSDIRAAFKCSLRGARERPWRNSRRNSRTGIWTIFSGRRTGDTEAQLRAAIAADGEACGRVRRAGNPWGTNCRWRFSRALLPHSRGRGPSHLRGRAVKGELQPTVPFVFERSAAASLGIMMPSRCQSGQVQIPKITTCSTGRHAGEGRRGSGDGCGGHAGQSGSASASRASSRSEEDLGRDADAGRRRSPRVDARRAVERIGRDRRSILARLAS